MFRRILGIIILIVALITMVIGVAGAIYLGQAVDSIGAGIDDTLALAADSMGTVAATLEQTKATIAEANNSITTAEKTAVDLSKTLADTIPLIEGVQVIVAEEAPQNIENVQDAIPNMAQVAGVVDTTLTTLANFGVDQKFVIPLPFGTDIEIPLAFDLGIEYEPVEPFDDTVLQLGAGLDGLPEQLRSLDTDLNVAGENLALVSDDILAASGDLAALNEQVALFIPLLDEYLAIVSEIDSTMIDLRGQIAGQLSTVKTALTVLMVFLALSQLAPLVFGWELLTGQRPGQGNNESSNDVQPIEPPQKTTAVAPPPDPEPITEVEDDLATVIEPVSDENA